MSTSEPIASPPTSEPVESVITECQRCRGRLDHARFTVRLEVNSAPEDGLALVICDHCRGSFFDWAARRARRSHHRSSQSSSLSLGRSPSRESRTRNDDSERSSRTEQEFVIDYPTNPYLTAGSIMGIFAIFGVFLYVVLAR